jgi:hypothetical protein
MDSTSSVTRSGSYIVDGFSSLENVVGSPGYQPMDEPNERQATKRQRRQQYERSTQPLNSAVAPQPTRVRTILKVLTVFLAVIGCAFSNVTRAESWLCISEKSAGLKEEGGIWNSRIFTTSTKIIIKPLDLSNTVDHLVYNMLTIGMTDDEKSVYKYSYGIFGHPGIEGLCDATTYDGVIYCKKDFGRIPNEEVIFNRTSMRFQIYQPDGYIFETNKTAKLTPFIEIGTCSRL